MSSGPADEEVLFNAARRIGDPDARAAYLHQACGDAKLRARVEALLAVHDREQSFLEPPPPVIAPAMSEPVMAEAPGTVIGPYTLLKEIGEGGMGVVYMAEQAEPVERRVALKIIKPGMDSRLVIGRFEAERQALALMNHPNIAQVLDAGTTDSGRPYFVMELVEGVSLTQFCDEQHLTPQQRLELFLPVCQAVQHAHQKGIIHRDLKPSNVMVTLFDGKPAPKVIDFGVAKATGPPLAERTMCTQFGQVVGTVEYMSPEQAEMNQLDIDTRSDIYSLGVLFYELLTGTTPFERKRLKDAALLEMLRIVREEEPPKPSTRLSTVEELPSIAANRGLEPKKLSGLVRGDLDWIVMKCLEKDRSRRYETANGLAMDLQRHLCDEPVTACPPSAVYRFRKFARRNRGVLATTAVVAAALILGTVVSTWQAGRALRAEALARQRLEAEEEQRRLAQNNAEEAQAERQRAVEQQRVAEAQKTRAEDGERLTRRYLYASHMNLAQQAVELPDPARAVRLLNMHRPGPGQEDLRSFEWYYWWDQSHRRLLRTLDTHADIVISVAFSPDGQTLASASYDGSVKLWDVASGLERTSLTGHRGVVFSLAFSPDGKTLASGSGDRTVKLWDTATSMARATLNGHTNEVRAVAYSPDGTTVASASLDHTVNLWDAATGQLQSSLAAHQDSVLAVAFSPDGKLIASGSRDGTVRLWDVGTGQPKEIFAGQRTQVPSVAFSPDGQTLAAAIYVLDGDSVVRLWDVASGEPKATLAGHTRGLVTVAFSPDGQTMASGGEDLSVKVWDLTTGQPKLILLGHGNSITCVAFSPDQKTLASASQDRTVKLWDLAAPEPKTLLSGHTKCVIAVAFSPDGRTLASASQDQTVTLWDVATGDLMTTLKGHTDEVTSVAFSPDGKTVASASIDDTVKFWDAASGEPKFTDLRDTGSVVGQAIFTNRVAFSPDGKTVATPGPDYSVKLWDAATGALKSALKAHESKILDLGFSPDGKTLASAGAWDKTARLWDLTTGQPKATLTGHSGWLWALAFSPSGKTLATASEDNTIKLWELATGQLTATLEGHAMVVWSLAFSPDGKTLASASYDKTIKLWDLATGEPKTTLRYEGGVRAVAFCPDGTILASGNGDGTIKLWHAPTNIDDPQ